MRTTLPPLLALAIGLGSLFPAAGAVTAYQSPADFMAAISVLGPDHVSDFESATAGDAYVNDPALSGFELSTVINDGPYVPAVGNAFWTSSGTQSLGLNDAAQQFSNSDVLTFTLSGMPHAFGLYVITGSDVIAGDLTLSLGGATVSNGSVAALQDGAGSFAYFLGFVSTSGIGSVTLNLGDPATTDFLFYAAVDDVHVVDAAPVPEPATLLLMSLGIGGLWLAGRRRGAAACLAALAVAAPAAQAAGGDLYLGEIVCGGFNFAPQGTLPANGQLLSISENTALFSLLGTQYGGDGRTTFALPDLRGRAIIKAGQGPGLSPYGQGEASGAETVTLLTANLPQHSHLVTPRGSLADATLISPAGAVPASKARTSYYASPGAAVAMAMALAQTGTRGNGAPVSVMQPSLVVNCFIVTQGIFPSRN